MATSTVGSAFSQTVNEVVEIIHWVGVQATNAYDTAMSLMEKIAIIDEIINVNTSVSAEKPVKPDPIMLGVIETDIAIDSVQGPESVTLGEIDASVTVGDVSPPSVDFQLPAFPTAPVFQDIAPPGLSFDFNESYYTSRLGDLLHQTLYDEINDGSTGLTATVEADIYARESERDALELQNAKDRIANLWSESGMSLPDGVLVSALAAADLEYHNRYSDKSRDVRIESFKRADDNAQFVKGLAEKYESLLMDYASKYWQRKLEAAGSTLEYAKSVYEALIKYEELFIRRYEAEMGGYKTSAEANSSLADAKTKVFESQVKYELGVADTKIKRSEVENEYQRTRVQNGQLGVQAFDSMVKYALGKAETEMKGVELKFEYLKAQVDKYQAEAQMFDAEGRFNIGAAEITIKGIEARIELLKAQIAAAVSASGNIAQVASTLAAGAMSAINANASLSATASIGESSSVSESDSNSFNVNHNYEHNSD